MININEKIPNVDLYILKDQKIKKIKSHELLSGRCIIFGIPGAFTTTCSTVHLPGFIQYKKKFSDLNVDFVGCIAVNDPYVMEAWGNVIDLEKSIVFISDGNSEFTEVLGLTLDLKDIGLGTRSRRYAMLIENLIVKNLSVDEVRAGCVASSADNFYKTISNFN